MKRLQLIMMTLFRNPLRRILITAELVVGLIMLFLCTSLRVKKHEVERYMDAYSDMAAVDPENAEQLAYVRNQGTVFPVTLRLTGAENRGKQFFGEINAAEYYRAVPLKLSAGSWFPEEDHGCQFNMVVPYSRRNRFLCGKSYELNFLQTGKVSVYICGVLDSDITFGNGFSAGFDDMNRILLLCPVKERDISAIPGLRVHAYVKLNKVDGDALKALDIDAVCLVRDLLRQGNRENTAVSLFLCITLLVLFGTALLGDHFLSGKENEKTFAIHFLCGADVRKALLLRCGSNMAEIVTPYCIALAAAWCLGIHLYTISSLGSLLVLIAGSILLSLFEMKRLSRKSPAQTIARRLQG